jgi:hypothetical protein
MEGHKISQEAQNCVSQCITKYWRDPQNRDPAEKHDRDYEACLTDCRICG